MCGGGGGGGGGGAFTCGAAIGHMYMHMHMHMRVSLSHTRSPLALRRAASLQEGAGHAVLSAYVEIVFDNSSGRITVDRSEVRLRRVIGLKKDEYFLDRKHIRYWGLGLGLCGHAGWEVGGLVAWVCRMGGRGFSCREKNAICSVLFPF
jgi:hypothetical protein